MQQQNRKGYFLFTVTEFGIKAVKAHIATVKDFSGRISIHNNYSVHNNHLAHNNHLVQNNYRGTDLVTGTFTRYTTNIKTYLFKSAKAHSLSSINATPEHAFYTVNRRAFIPISKITPMDTLINSQGEKLRLVCSNGRVRNCGTPYGHRQLMPVYNLEVNRSHHYFAGKNHILVHNGCFDDYLRNHLEGKSPKEAAEFIVAHVNKYIRYSSTKIRVASKNKDEIDFVDAIIAGLDYDAIYEQNTKSPAFIDLVTDEVLRTQCGNSHEMCYVGYKVLKWYNFKYPVKLLKVDDNFFILLGKDEPDIWVADPWNDSFYPEAQVGKKMKLYAREGRGASILPLSHYQTRYPEAEITFLPTLGQQ